MKVQCLLQKFTLGCIARDMRMLHIEMFISNAVQEIIQTNKNDVHVQIKLPWIPEAPGRSLVSVGRSFSQLIEMKQKHCVAKMGITCQDLTNLRISQNWILPSDWMRKTTGCLSEPEAEVPVFPFF